MRSCWVVREGELHRQAIEPGARADDRVMVRSGLLGGDAVVVTDSPDLRNGRSVRPIGSDAGAVLRRDASVS